MFAWIMKTYFDVKNYWRTLNSNCLCPRFILVLFKCPWNEVSTMWKLTEYEGIRDKIYDAFFSKMILWIWYGNIMEHICVFSVYILLFPMAKWIWWMNIIWNGRKANNGVVLIIQLQLDELYDSPRLFINAVFAFHAFKQSIKVSAIWHMTHKNTLKI